MSIVGENPPLGTPTWIDLGIPDLDQAMEFYGALFGWTFDVGPAETGGYTMCLLRDRPVAALMQHHDQGATDFWWNVYFATPDCDATVARIMRAGGQVITDPMDVMDAGRMAIAADPTGGQFGLWQGRRMVGCELVNEPGALIRNDLATADPGRARPFYAEVFDFTLDRNEAMPDLDFTFLRRPDGHEVAGIIGGPTATRSAWNTTFVVADTDDVVERATARGGKAGAIQDTIYARTATLTDPFGAEFTVGARPAGAESHGES